MAIFHTGDIATEQTRPFLNMALREFLLFAKFAESVTDQHAGIIPERRIEGKQGLTGWVEGEVLNASTSCYIRAPSPAHGGSVSDKSFEWQNELQVVVHNPNASDVSAKVAHLRATLTARLRIMTPVDCDERMAIKRALAVLRMARTRKVDAKMS
jgi:hypothetical protein